MRSVSQQGRRHTKNKIVTCFLRFLAIILGPEGSSAKVVEKGRAIGSLLTDQV